MHCRSVMIKKHKRKLLGIILNVDVQEKSNAAGSVSNISKINLAISTCRIGNGQMCRFDWVPLDSALNDLMESLQCAPTLLKKETNIWSIGRSNHCYALCYEDNIKILWKIPMIICPKAAVKWNIGQETSLLLKTSGV